MSEKQTFETVLEKHGAMDATGITVPFDVEKTFGAKRVPVKVTINGATHLSTIVKMGGKYVVGVPKVFRAAANVNAGDVISVMIEKDTAKRTVEIPEDFAAALRKADLTDAFGKMSYTHQKEHVRAIEESKKAETRLRRIEKAIEQIAAQ